MSYPSITERKTSNWQYWKC